MTAEPVAAGSKALDELCINTVRVLSMEAVQRANSGHPGAPMGQAAICYALWTRHLHHNPSDPTWEGRDRFVLSVMTCHSRTSGTSVSGVAARRDTPNTATPPVWKPRPVRWVRE
jgi:hypothetical protein